ncbi:MAG: penicillin-binding protein 1C [Ignavibacteriales bacterium]|nr:penicillin-binding protein 1C [Ignavibacteriales bacterium]
MARHILETSALALVAFVCSTWIPHPRTDFGKESVHSLQVTDRNGILLREFLNDQQGRGQWRPLSSISPFLQQATIAVEDKRFWYHPGVDPLAVLRALGQNIKTGSLKSGGSGITQQVIRNVYHHPRTLSHKILEAWYAFRLEWMMSKDEILEQYLNRAPYGNQLFGVEAASRHYFQKPASNLSLAEAAFLAALPNAPSLLNPYENLAGVLERQKHVLQKMLELGLASQDEYERARVQPLRIVPPSVNFRAPHAVEMAVARLQPGEGVSALRTTIDYPLQQKLQLVVRNQLQQLARKNVSNATVVVIENSTGAVRALVGSANYFDREHQGQVNGALALRQPGSALKPFTYGIAFEAGNAPADVVADIPTQIPDVNGDYVPENYDKKFHGPVRIRTALACSYNVPAVRLLRNFGVSRLYERLRVAGLTSLTEPPGHYGYGLTLGNADVRLLELTTAYSSLANRGTWKPWRLVESARTVNGSSVDARVFFPDMERSVFNEKIAFLVSDVLSDPVARRPAFGNAFRFPFQCAVKTGTTKDYRDNWTIGYTSEFSVGVWAGNFDGKAMRGVSGISGAGGIFFDVMMSIYDRPFKYPAPFVAPHGLEKSQVCAVSGLLRGSSCNKTTSDWYVKGRAPTRTCGIHQLFKVQSLDGDSYERTFEILPPEYQSWALEQRIPSPPPGSVRIMNTPPAARRRDIAILSPGNGEIFKIDPILRKEYQTIKISGVVPKASHQVKVHIDNGQSIPYEPQGVWWELQKGLHRFRLEAVVGERRIFSEAVTVQVE